jgi:sulfur carrier protein ThiS
MAVRVQLSDYLQKYVSGYDHNTGVVMESADGWTVRMIIEELKIPLKEVSIVMINSYPGNTQSTLKDGDFILLTKIFGGG